MENLKLKTIDFIMKNKEIEEKNEIKKNRIFRQTE